MASKIVSFKVHIISILYIPRVYLWIPILMLNDTVIIFQYMSGGMNDE